MTKSSEYWLATLLEGVNKYRLADRLLLLRCNDNKMVKLPGYSSIGASSCSNKKKNRPLFLIALSHELFMVSIDHIMKYIKAQRKITKRKKIHVVIFLPDY